MGDIAIRVEHLGKQYRLGGQQVRYATFRDALVNAARAPLGWLKGERRAQSTSFWALDDVSFEVKHGEAVGIIGRNGAGKSTLLKILSRITSPTRGRVDIYGRVGSLLEVGTGFHPELTGRENIFLNGAILGMTRHEIMRKYDEIVAFAEIDKFLDTAVKFYSSGMYMRLAFAVAAHLETEVLLVDEVLAVGDAEFQKKCLGKMGDVAKQGRTVVFVSHNMGAIKNLCPKSLRLDSGKFCEFERSDKVIFNYLLERQENVDNFSLPIRDLNLPIEYGKIIITDNQGVGRNVFHIGENWVFRLEFSTTKKLSNLVVGIGFSTFEGVPITTYWSEQTDIEAGEYCVNFIWENNLASCILQMNVGFSVFDQNLFYFEGIGRITITEISLGDQPYRASGTGILSNSQRSKILKKD